MEKRKFLHTVAGGALGLAFSPLLAAEKKPSKEYVAPTVAHVLEGFDGVTNQAVRLEDFAGKTLLVSFFTFECVPCHQDLRLMREFYQANKARNFVMLGVNMDKQRDAFMEYMHLIDQTIPKEQHFPIVWRNAPGHKDSFGTIATKPTHFVLNKTLKQVMRREGPFQAGDWDDLWTNLS
ncbi:MAG: TlpA disulfide reductase family protein [Pseudomonadota bacterium]